MGSLKHEMQERAILSELIVNRQRREVERMDLESLRIQAGLPSLRPMAWPALRSLRREARHLRPFRAWLIRSLVAIPLLLLLPLILLSLATLATRDLLVNLAR